MSNKYSKIMIIINKLNNKLNKINSKLIWISLITIKKTTHSLMIKLSLGSRFRDLTKSIIKKGRVNRMKVTIFPKLII